MKWGESFEPVTPVPKKGLSVEALESRRTNIGMTRINFLFTTYCI